MNHPFAPPTWLPIARNRRFAQAKRVIDRVVLDLIARRRRDGEVHDDLLAMLMAAQDEETHGGMTDQQVRDEALTLLTAGHETVGAALSWTWYLLSKHLDVQRSLHDEVVGVLGGRHPTTSDLSRLPLCRAVFEEAMRLYPPAWAMPRESIEADEIMGYHIPPKAAIVLGQFLTHRHPEFWESPDQFRPERFLGELPASRPRYAYFPFGGGPRVCIGSQFAMIEAQLVLATVIHELRDGPRGGSSGRARPHLHAQTQVRGEGGPTEPRLSHGSTSTLSQVTTALPFGSPAFILRRLATLQEHHVPVSEN